MAAKNSGANEKENGEGGGGDTDLVKDGDDEEDGGGNTDLEEEIGAKMAAPGNEGWAGQKRRRWPRQATSPMAQENGGERWGVVADMAVGLMAPVA